MHSKNRMARLCMILPALALAACSPPTIRVRGEQPLNVNTVHESTPVAVRFYQLTDDNAFLTAPFEGLWTDAAKNLGGNLVGQVLVRTISPGTAADDAVVLELPKREDATRFIGVLALYRAGDGSPRQTVVPIEQLDDGVVVFSGYSVRFVTDDEARRNRNGEATEPPREEPKAEPQSTAGGEPESSAASKPASDKSGKDSQRYQTPDDEKGSRK